MDISKILVVVKFGGALIFWLWDIDFFRRMGNFWTCDFSHGNFSFFFFIMGNFLSCGFGHGNFFGHVILGMGILDMWFWSWEFFGHVILVMGIFWTRDFGHGNFFWTCSFGHGNFLGMWFWLWEFFGHGKFFLSWEIFDHVETLNETSLEFTWWGLVALI